MKMEIENNSQNSLVKTGNRAIFAAPKGESARIATAKTAFCTYFATICNYFATILHGCRFAKL